MAGISFIRNFFKEKKMVGALAPSSQFLAKKMMKHIDFNSARLLVEFGPGNGIFTKKILERMHSEAKLIVFELNEGFYQQLIKEVNDTRVIFLNQSASDLTEYLKIHNLSSVDYIISSLPLANFPKEVVSEILKAVNVSLKSEGKYIQFQYSLTSRKHLRKVFSEIDLNFTMLNLPPAFVYTCSGLKEI